MFAELSANENFLICFYRVPSTKNYYRLPRFRAVQNTHRHRFSFTKYNNNDKPVLNEIDVSCVFNYRYHGKLSAQSAFVRKFKSSQKHDIRTVVVPKKILNSFRGSFLATKRKNHVLFLQNYVIHVDTENGYFNLYRRQRYRPIAAQSTDHRKKSKIFPLFSNPSLAA